MYKDKEKLILLRDVGKKGSENFIPAGSEVLFIKAIDDPNNLAKSFVIVQYENRQMALPELAVKPKGSKTIEALKDVNIYLMENNPELKKYHHNIFVRPFYSVLFWIKGLFSFKKRDKSTQFDKKLEDELKKLMNEETL